MKLLLIEDDKNKSTKIQNYLKEKFDIEKVVEKHSLRSSLKELVENGKTYDMILMDMSMPNYDISPEEPEGGSHESFAGRDLLSQMKLRNINTPVLIITQYDTFGETIKKLSLEELKKQLAHTCEPIYKGTIYYNSAQDNWKKDLFLNIKKIMDGEND